MKKISQNDPKTVKNQSLFIVSLLTQLHKIFIQFMDYTSATVKQQLKPLSSRRFEG